MAATVVRSKIVAVGNSKGVRIPRSLLGDAQVGDVVELVAEGGDITIRRPKTPREGWRDAFRAMHEAGDDRLLLPETALSSFEDDAWTW